MQKLDDFRIKSDQFFDAVTKRAIVPSSSLAETNQKLLGISDEVLEKYYQTAWRFLEDKNWFDAMDSFLFLSFLNPYVHAFWIGLGLAEQSQQKYNDALIAYTMAEATNPSDPVAYANAYQCGIALGEHEYARFSLKKAISCCEDKPEFAGLLQRLQQIKTP